MILQTLWNIDPGYFRLKHAAKTILAILMTLWLLPGEEKALTLMAGIVSGFSMQGVVALSFSSRIKQIIALNVAYFLAFVLGLLARDMGSWGALILIFVGFVGTYLRRFDLQNSVAPVMGWILCFFAMVLPFSSTSIAWEHIHWLVIALLVSIFVNGFVWPENYPRLFVANSNRLFKILAQIMYEIRRYVLDRNEKLVFERGHFSNQIDTLTRLLDSNQAMEESGVFSNKSDEINTILIHQYALVHACMTMIDAFSTLVEQQHHLSRPARLGFGQKYKQFQLLFKSMAMHVDYSVEMTGTALFLSSKLTYVPPSEPTIIMVLLNLKLGFGLLTRHAMQLIRGADEA